MKKSIRFMFAFVIAISVGYGASEAQARIKQRCDPVCLDQCAASGAPNCARICGCDL